jgi:hypothetical protein
MVRDVYKIEASDEPLLVAGAQYSSAKDDMRRFTSDLDCGARASAKLQHASTVTPSWNDTPKLLDELRLGERLCELWQNRLGLRFHFSEAGRDYDRKFRPLPFYRIGKLQARHVWHGVVGDDQVD